MKTITMLRGFSAALLLGGLATTAACGGEAALGPKAKGADGSAIKTSSGSSVSEKAASKFKAALDTYAAHEKANDWNEGSCAATAKMFLDAASEQGGSFAEATYNAGLSYKACNKTADAKNYFQQTLSKDAKFHRARMQLALYKFVESGEKDFDGPIGEMRQAAIVDAQFKNVEALVHLGMLYMRRNNNVGDNDGASDVARAKKYAQSALAVDDTYMPAFNLLALIYLEAAKQKAGKASGRKVATNVAKEKKVDTQALELAALVCSQAIRKNPGYAAIHNTAGMINVELGNLNSAVASFNTARKLDPGFYEAQMNFAAVNMQFRGFSQAEEAYRAALKMRPSDYEAHLGLALALRGQIDDSNFDKMLPAASSEIDAAKKVAPDRAETYYNDAILTQEYKAKSGKDQEKHLNDAKGLFQQFINKAGGSAEYADAVKRSKERMTEIDQIIAFNKQTEAERKASEADLKTKAAEAEAKSGEEGGDAKDAPKGDKPN